MSVADDRAGIVAIWRRAGARNVALPTFRVKRKPGAARPSEHRDSPRPYARLELRASARDAVFGALTEKESGRLMKYPG
jgi:hypothetical protein